MDRGVFYMEYRRLPEARRFWAGVEPTVTNLAEDHSAETRRTNRPGFIARSLGPVLVFARDRLA
jgi:hypothetical protein